MILIPVKKNKARKSALNLCQFLSSSSKYSQMDFADITKIPKSPSVKVILIISTPFG
jgi:hypothetical protein